MTLEKAREWASRHDRIRGVFHPDAKAAVEVIQSLPDKWVDVEEVQEIIEEMESLPDTTRVSSEIAIATEAWKRRLEALLPSKLPTLADMTPEERAACKWMQCKVETDGEDTIGVIWMIWSNRVHIIFQSGIIFDAEYRRVTPLTGEPKLEWPGSGGTPTIAQKEKVADDQAVAKDVCNSESNSSETPKSSIKPEDVPPNEPWLIEVDGQEAIGTRYKGDAHTPWAVAALGGSFADDDYHDHEITLIHRLVPETHTLPEGMRLADHADIGRVIVSPRLIRMAHTEFSAQRTTATGHRSIS